MFNKVVNKYLNRNRRTFVISEAFDNSFEELLGVEGGYVDDKYDRGGKTKYGITEAVARGQGYTGEMKDLDLAFAKSIYKRLYWDVNLLSFVAFNDTRIANEMFEAGVNMGTTTVARFFQRALNVLNKDEKLFKDIKVDGRIGEKTLKAFDKLTLKQSSTLLKILNVLQGHKYIQIMEGDSKQERFCLGWFRRVGVL